MGGNESPPSADLPLAVPRFASHITDHASPITAVVLAAGAGRRMGTQKLLLPFRGRPLLEWTLELVESLPLKRRLIVLGSHAGSILKDIFGLRSSPPIADHPSRATRHENPPHPLLITHHDHLWEVLINRGWAEGMGSSLRLAAQVVDGGILVFLGDMPLVPREAALEVLSRAEERPVAPVYRGRRGFPVYLPPGLRPRLLELKGDVGARELIRERCELFPMDDPGVVFDVDRAQQARGRSGYLETLEGEDGG